MTQNWHRVSEVEEKSSILKDMLDNFCEDPKRHDTLQNARARKQGLALLVEGTLKDLEAVRADPSKAPPTMALATHSWKTFLAALSEGPRREAAAHFDAGRGVLAVITQDGRLRLRGYESVALTPGGDA